MQPNAQAKSETSPSNTAADQAATPIRGGMTGRALVFATLAVGGLWWDLFSKNRVFQDLGVGGQSLWRKEWFGGWMTCSLHTTFNFGALWGVGQGFSMVFAALSVVAAAGIVYWLFWRGGARSAWLTVALALIMGGTLGNLYDRLGWHGFLKDGEPVRAVRDFLLFTFGTYHWPVFNFADVFLVTGAIMLVVQSLRAELAAAAEPSAATTSAPGVAPRPMAG